MNLVQLFKKKRYVKCAIREDCRVVKRWEKKRNRKDQAEPKGKRREEREGGGKPLDSRRLIIYRLA